MLKLSSTGKPDELLASFIFSVTSFLDASSESVSSIVKSFAEKVISPKELFSFNPSEEISAAATLTGKINVKANKTAVVLYFILIVSFRYTFHIPQTV